MYHTGLDIASDSGTPIYAPASGIIVLVQENGVSNGRQCTPHVNCNDHGMGNTIIVAHTDLSGVPALQGAPVLYEQFSHLDSFAPIIDDACKDKWASPRGGYGRTCMPAVQVVVGQELGFTGATGYGFRHYPKYGWHLHYEIKTFGILEPGLPMADRNGQIDAFGGIRSPYDEACGGCGFGYTKMPPYEMPPTFDQAKWPMGHPGYINPLVFLHDAQAITPQRQLTLTHSMLYVGPGAPPPPASPNSQYRWEYEGGSASAFLAFRYVPPQNTRGACARGALEVRRADGQPIPDDGYSASGRTTVTDGWICAPDGFAFESPESRGRPTIQLTPAAVQFSVPLGFIGPIAPQTVSVRNGGSGSLRGLSVRVNYSLGQSTNWLTATIAAASPGSPPPSPFGGVTAPAVLTLVPKSGLLPGLYLATVVVSSSVNGVTNSPQSVNVALSVTAPKPPPVGGDLTLTLAGVPSPYYARVSIVGPSGYSQSTTVSASGPTVLQGLAPGTYTLTWAGAQCPYQSGCGPVSYGPTGSPQTVQINGATSATQTYAITTGRLTVSPVGLPSALYTIYQLTDPTGFLLYATQTNAVYGGNSFTFDNLTPGVYTVSWSTAHCPYQAGCNLPGYRPVSQTQQVTVTPSLTPAQANMTFVTP